MKRIAVLTSGSDAPGMNACIRAVVRAASYYDISTIGFFRGYEGLINGDFMEMDNRSVSNIIQSGGTILKCGDSDAFKTVLGREMAYSTLIKNNIDGLIVIGGQGTFKGAEEFYREFGIPCIGIPGTIDNDILGTDFTIGYDSAVNTALNAIDQLRDTADSHERVFFIEVMGRDTGYIAVRCAIAGGAEMAIMPERNISMDEVILQLKHTTNNSSSSHIVIVAEQIGIGKTDFIFDSVKSALPKLDIKVTTLGYVQRGGAPTSADRVLASQLGLGAVEGLMNGKTNMMVGVINELVCYTPIEVVANKRKPISNDLIRIIEILNGSKV
jgi:6-phosphofructokinase 1